MYIREIRGFDYLIHEGEFIHYMGVSDTMSLPLIRDVTPNDPMAPLLPYEEPMQPLLDIPLGDDDAHQV